MQNEKDMAASSIRHSTQLILALLVCQAYIASKHAVAGLTKTAALVAAKSGIRVSAVATTAIDTQMLADIQNNITPDAPEVSGEAIKQGIPLGIFGAPKEVAQVVLFLASDHSFVTESLYNVDVGMQMQAD